MRIDERLNIVIPVELENGSTVHVHSIPISRAIYEQYFIVISRTFAAIMNQNMPGIALRTAGLWLKKTAQDMNQWNEVREGLVNEIHRLTNVAMIGKNGWDTLPFQQCISGKMLSEEDISEVESALIFFTCISWMLRKSQKKDMLAILASLLTGQIVSSNSTEFTASLTTSTKIETTGETVQLKTAQQSSRVY